MVPQSEWTSVLSSPSATNLLVNSSTVCTSYVYYIHVRCRAIRNSLSFTWRRSENVLLVTCFISSVPLIQKFKSKRLLPHGKTEEAKLQDDKTIFPLSGQWTVIYTLICIEMGFTDCFGVDGYGRAGILSDRHLCWREANLAPILCWMVLTRSTIGHEVTG